MKKHFFKLLIFLVIIAVSSCIKPKIEPDSLRGKWEFSKFDFVIYSKNVDASDTINSRETITESGFIQFDNTVVNGEQQLNGTFRMPKNFNDPMSPFYNNGKPILVDSDFTMGTFEVSKSKYNYRNQLTGTVKNSFGNVLYEFMTIKQISKKKITIEIGRIDEVNPSETESKLIYIELKKA